MPLYSRWLPCCWSFTPLRPHSPAHPGSTRDHPLCFLDGSADYQPLADAFHHEHPHITVELVAVAKTEDYVTRFNSEITKADAFRAPAGLLSGRFGAKAVPLDSILDTDRSFPRADLFPGSLDVLRANGKQMGFPAGLETMAVFYNPQKFKDAGIQPPGPDWTLDDFLQAAASINNQKDLARFTYGFCSSANASADAQFFTYLFGGDLFDSSAHPTRPG